MLFKWKYRTANYQASFLQQYQPECKCITNNTFYDGEDLELRAFHFRRLE